MPYLAPVAEPSLDWEEVDWSILPEDTGTTVAIKDWLVDNIRQPRALRQKQLFVIGLPGCGKSSMILRLEKYLRIYYLPMHEDWYDEYEDDKYDVIVVDEFHPVKEVTFMLKLLDGQPLYMKRKGMTALLKRQKIPIILMGNHHPSTMYVADHVAWMDRLQVVDVPQFEKLHCVLK
jgi:hypothetical protein